MTLDDLIEQLRGETNQLILDIKQVDGADEYTCDSLQTKCNDLMLISIKLTGYDSDITSRLVKTHHTLARMLQVD